MRLIDADELKNRKIVIDYGKVEDTFEDGLLFVTDLIDKSPTIDAVPVRHGKWIPHMMNQQTLPIQWGYDCSNCGVWHVFGKDYINLYHFCPNCGSIMDGKEEGK